MAIGNTVPHFSGLRLTDVARAATCVPTCATALIAFPADDGAMPIAEVIRIGIALPGVSTPCVGVGECDNGPAARRTEALRVATESAIGLDLRNTVPLRGRPTLRIRRTRRRRDSMHSGSGIDNGRGAAICTHRKANAQARGETQAAVAGSAVGARRARRQALVVVFIDSHSCCRRRSRSRCRRRSRRHQESPKRTTEGPPQRDPRRPPWRGRR